MQIPNRRQSSQAGFTLIELVMVIVILGILAATALPKFVDLATDARTSVMSGVQSSLQAANTMIYAKAAATNKLGADTTVSFNGTSIKVSYGYAQDLSALTNAAVLTLTPAADFTIANTAAVTVVGPPASVTTEGSGTITHVRAATGTKCVIKYTGVKVPGGAPGYITGTDLTDCS